MVVRVRVCFWLFCRPSASTPSFPVPEGPDPDPDKRGRPGNRTPVAQFKILLPSLFPRKHRSGRKREACGLVAYGLQNQYGWRMQRAGATRSAGALGHSLAMADLVGSAEDEHEHALCCARRGAFAMAQAEAAFLVCVQRWMSAAVAARLRRHLGPRRRISSTEISSPWPTR